MLALDAPARSCALLPYCVLLGACAYQPGSFSTPRGAFAGEYLTVDCLDLAIERRPALPGGQQVVGYEFGNRCDHGTVVDLAAANVVGRTERGAWVALAAYDPRREVRALRLDGRASGHEALAYGSAPALAAVCVDAAAIAHASPPRWLCFEASPAPRVARASATTDATTAGRVP